MSAQVLIQYDCCPYENKYFEQKCTMIWMSLEEERDEGDRSMNQGMAKVDSNCQELGKRH